jgi:S1-C subfamily serine protease
MKKRALKIVGWTAALLLILGVGAVVGAGIVYAMTQDSDSISFIFKPDGEELFDPEPGIVIAAVVADGPAEEAGVVRGDILLQIDGESVDGMVELMAVLGEHEAGDEVKLTVLHGDDERALTATLGDRDDVAYLGVVPCAGVPVPEQRLRIYEDKPGATITDVVPDTPADQAGLQEGDVIVAVDEQELDLENSLADVITAYEPGDTVTLQVERPGEEPREVTVELGEHPDREGVAYLGVQYGPSWKVARQAIFSSSRRGRILFLRCSRQ